jgi:hypothetical protein
MESLNFWQMIYGNYRGRQKRTNVEAAYRLEDEKTAIHSLRQQISGIIMWEQGAKTYCNTDLNSTNLASP